MRPPSAYSGTKAFVVNLTQSLYREVKNKGLPQPQSALLVKYRHAFVTLLLFGNYFAPLRPRFGTHHSNLRLCPGQNKMRFI
jgi:hypothetical protein